jgi:tRNA-splicing ligase RtcB
MSNGIKAQKIDDYTWEIPKTGGMHVPGRVYADETLFASVARDNCLQQVVNVAHLQGIVRYSMAMPDAHWGYGFPIGGVAGTDVAEGGVISPGGVGYDINCGCRVLVTQLTRDDVKDKIGNIVNALYSKVPCGVGSSGAISKLSVGELKKLLRDGAAWAVKRGYGSESDLERTEERGAMESADPDALSERALERGRNQVGTLGSGNHFLEVGVVERVFDPEVARVFGLEEGRITLMIHSGSRGLGYQVCDDSLKVMQRAVEKYHLRIPDRQLACAPVESPEGRRYLAAMSAAANYAWTNRQVMMALAERALEHALGASPKDLGLRLVYDVCHNIAKLEKHDVAGERKTLCVHRKGATRSFPPGHPDVPGPYKDVGQPVLVPGDMGTGSYVCVGTNEAMENTFGSACHGAGRMMSRSKAIKRGKGRSIDRELEQQGIIVKARQRKTLAEEMPDAYKNVDAVVDVMHAAEICRKVVRIHPIGVVKG